MYSFLKRIQYATLLLSVLVTLPVMAQNQETSRRTIVVSGEGILRVEPDMATARFGIVTRHEDPEEARRLNAEASRETMNAVRALGVEERKIKLETLRIQPAREYNQQTRRYDEVGFEVVREVVVTLDDTEKLPQLVTAVVQKGANRLMGVAYDLSDRNGVRNEALQQAILSAREKAVLMTSTLGVKLGQVLQISEQGVSVPRPMVNLAMQDVRTAKVEMAAPEPEAYASGEIEVHATVQVVFALQ